MTSEEWGKHVAVQRRALRNAVGLLCQSLQVAGVPLYSMEIVERGSDRLVKATFTWGDAGRTSAWTPRIRRFGTFCDRSRSLGRKER